MTSSYDCIVLGGGAAGLMCALTAGRRGRRVLVIEHANRVGKKILMSGGGRCNFTNTGTTPAQFLSANPHYCKSALARFVPADFIAMVDRHGIAWHEKELGQLFCNESSRQIVAMLLAECAAAQVQIQVSTGFTEVRRAASGFLLQTSAGEVQSASLVVATGGLPIPSMGATGIGLELARQFGHAVLPTRAALVPLTFSGSYLEQYQDLSGLAVPVCASVGKTRFSNAMLITHRGISGPAILQISSYWQAGEPLRIDLLPQLDAHDWLRQQQRERPRVELLTVLAEQLPRRLAQRLLELWVSAAQRSQPMQHYSHRLLAELAEKLHHWPVQPSGTEGYRTAEVMLGGVDTRGLDSATMGSRSVPGLYFIGEVVDVTGHLGGYNFQWAWASGYAAGQVV
jgi:predicted Rossmann fold flavoprotein